MKKILIFLSAITWVAISSISGTAEQWSFFSPAGSITRPVGFTMVGSGGGFTSGSEGVLDIFADSGFASIVPIQVDQLVVSLVSLKTDGKAMGVDPKPILTEFQLNTGIRTEKYLEDFESLLMDQMFSSEPSSSEQSSSVVFVGIGMDFNGGYLKGSAFLGHPKDLLGNSLYRAKKAYGGDKESLDTGSHGFEASGAYQLSDSVALGAGFGQVTEKNKETDKTEEIYAVYAQAILAVAPGVQVIPEVGQVEHKKEESETKKADESFYAGAKWEINF